MSKTFVCDAAELRLEPEPVAGKPVDGAVAVGAGCPAAAVTTIVPVMSGWIEQM